MRSTEIQGHLQVFLKMRNSWIPEHLLSKPLRIAMQNRFTGKNSFILFSFVLIYFKRINL